MWQEGVTAPRGRGTWRWTGKFQASQRQAIKTKRYIGISLKKKKKSNEELVRAVLLGQ